MIIEEREFDFTHIGYTNAVIFLKQIGRYSEEHKHLPMDYIIHEANEIKGNQQILTE